MTSLNIKKIKGCIDNGQYSKGATCLFVPYSKRFGAKLFAVKKDRDFAHMMQKRSYKYDLAPRTYSKFSCNIYGPMDITAETLDSSNEYYEEEDEWGFYNYGYITEIVTVPNVMTDELDEQMCDLIEKIESVNIGLATFDVARRNVGIKSNKLVLIDFDPGTHGS